MDAFITLFFTRTKRYRVGVVYIYHDEEVCDVFVYMSVDSIWTGVRIPSKVPR